MAKTLLDLSQEGINVIHDRYLLGERSIDGVHASELLTPEDTKVIQSVWRQCGADVVCFERRIKDFLNRKGIE